MRQIENNMPIRHKILVIVVLVLLIVVTVGGVLYWGVVSSQERERWVAHTHEVIGTTDDLMLQLVNMQTGMRGFAVTGNKVFLEPYEAGREAYQDDFAHLTNLVSDNPEQTARLSEIDEAVQEWKANVLEPIISLHRQENTYQGALREVDAFISSGQGKRRLDAIRAHIGTFRETEVMLLRERELESEAAATVSRWLLIGGIGTAVAFGLISAVVITNRITRRINSVTDAATSMAAGNLDIVHVVPDGRDEIGTLAGAFTTMADTIRSQMQEQKQAEAERAALHEQVIDAQRAALRELSTPLIPVSDNVVIMPLIGTIDTGRAQQVMETLLEGVAHYRATLAILDITGVSVVDTQVAQALIGAAQAVKLLGAQVMLTGIQPQIAQTLVHLGVDLSGIETRGSLQSGIAYALRRS
jgi:anti-anti-sigma factor